MNSTFDFIQFNNISLIKEINDPQSIYFLIFNSSLILIFVMFYKCKNIIFKKNNNNLLITLDTYLNKGDDQIKLLSSNALTTEQLKNLNNYSIEEVTPIGVVKLSYDYNHEAFVYYADVDIPYKYLEVVARLFVIKYNCKSLYIDYKEQLFQSRDKYFANKKQKNNNLQVNSIYAISKNKKLPENSKIYIVPEESNKYIKKGKIKDLVEENKIKERQEMKDKNTKKLNFRDFKKIN